MGLRSCRPVRLETLMLAETSGPAIHVDATSTPIQTRRRTITPPWKQNSLMGVASLKANLVQERFEAPSASNDPDLRVRALWP